jgi:hypothetical protein
MIRIISLWPNIANALNPKSASFCGSLVADFEFEGHEQTCDSSVVSYANPLEGMLQG